jgi:GNAT superfamily N-acetyltransferase
MMCEPQQWYRDGYVISTDPSRLDLEAVLHFLSTESYWGKTMTMPRLSRALDNSMPIGIYAPNGSLAGFARVVTDYAVFAYLRDVFVLTEHRGRGLATWLATVIREHPELTGITSWMLATRDAHGVYERAGFRRAPHPEWYMTIPKP